MFTYFLQIILCLFVMVACTYSIICENRRNDQMNKIFKSLKERYESQSWGKK